MHAVFLHCRIVSEFSVGTFEGWLAAWDKRCIKEALFKTPFIRSKQASSFYLNRQTPFIRSRQPALLKDRRCMQEAFIQRWNKERSRNSGDGEWTVVHITWSNSLSNVGWMHGGLTDNKLHKESRQSLKSFHMRCIHSMLKGGEWISPVA